MGVNLERVQNKFACIIGELCSEPLVLSQFAVWLDLRLAEYKAKGSICLECCGDVPSPVWLKGLPLKHQAKQDETWLPTSYAHSPERPDQAGDMDDRPPWQRQSPQMTFTQSPHRTKPPQQQHNTDHSPLHSSIPTNRSSRNHLAINRTKAQSQHSPVAMVTDAAMDRLYSPSTQTVSRPVTALSDIVIKQEVVVDDEPDIIPVALHVHENIQGDSRKRTVSDLADNGIARTHSPGKHKKMTPTDSATVTSASSLTQDLSSIIGVQDHSEESLASDNAESDVTVMGYGAMKTQDDDSDIEELSQPSGSSFPAMSSFPHSQTSLQDTSLDFSAIQTDNDSDLPRLSQSGAWIGHSSAEPRTSAVPSNLGGGLRGRSWTRPRIYDVRDVTHDVRGVTHDIHDVTQKVQNVTRNGQDMMMRTNHTVPVSTARNTNHAVCLFQRWIQERLSTGEDRPIETLESDLLDYYLVEFFSTVKKRMGGEYSPKSLKALREGLERYLKSHDYPYSITVSPQFYNSQVAYKKRYILLQEKNKLEYLYSK